MHHAHQFSESLPRNLKGSLPTVKGIKVTLQQRNADSFRTDLHPDLMADFMLATATRGCAKTIASKSDRRSVGATELPPPFNISDWGGEHLRQSLRWKYRMPPVNNANYA